MELASLRDVAGQLQPTYTKAVIQAALRTPQGVNRTWIVVEDIDDVKVYEPFFNSSKTKLLTSEDQNGLKGCAHVETIVTEILTEETKVFIFGIRDTDYTTYEETVHEFPPSVFHTDHRDVEMMMLSTPSVTASLSAWNETIIRKMQEGEPIARKMGYMRICNHIYNLGCGFKKKVKVSMIWNQTTHTVLPDWENILLTKFLENCGNNPFSLEQFNETVVSKHLENENYLDICQGHDVVRLLQYMMIQNEYSEAKIMEHMTNAYSVDDFKDTALYDDISNWASSRGIEVFSLADENS